VTTGRCVEERPCEPPSAQEPALASRDERQPLQRETEAVGRRGWPPAADGAGSASVGDGALGLLGADNRDREAERLDAMG
jgi:hypothetical protein